MWFDGLAIINAEDSSAQRVQGARFDIFAVRDHPDFVVGRDKDVLCRIKMGPHAEELPVGGEPETAWWSL